MLESAKTGIDMPNVHKRQVAVYIEGKRIGLVYSPKNELCGTLGKLWARPRPISVSRISSCRVYKKISCANDDGWDWDYSSGRKIIHPPKSPRPHPIGLFHMDGIASRFHKSTR